MSEGMKCFFPFSNANDHLSLKFSVEGVRERGRQVLEPLDLLLAGPEVSLSAQGRNLGQRLLALHRGEPERVEAVDAQALERHVQVEGRAGLGLPPGCGPSVRVVGQVAEDADSTAGAHARQDGAVEVATHAVEEDVDAAGRGDPKGLADVLSLAKGFSKWNYCLNPGSCKAEPNNSSAGKPCN